MLYYDNRGEARRMLGKNIPAESMTGYIGCP
jgi:hypothetical protein